jgi:hypothetical protein
MIDSDKAFRLANDYREALDAEAVVLVVFKDGEFCCDIIGRIGEPMPDGIEKRLRELAESVARSRT